MSDKFEFQYASPEECGVESEYIYNFLEKLNKCDINMHSFILMRHDHIICEAYYSPFTAESNHRMFSAAKSVVSLAIGLLINDGRIKLDDRIVDYFPEKLPESGVHEYMQMLTIEDMLTMRTCHSKNAYKATDLNDWVEAFFTVKPSNVPGTQFAYDTASTHCLCALVEKLTGMDILDFMRMRVLDKMNFTKGAHMLKTEDGVSQGGSGLCATAMDLFKIIYLVAKKGIIDGEEIYPSDYIKAATSRHSAPIAKQDTLEEKIGYGYQFWLVKNSGVAIYGMAGQLAVYLKDKDLLFVTTADTMNIKAGTETIYEAFFAEIYDKLDAESYYNPADSAEGRSDSAEGKAASAGNMADGSESRVGNIENERLAAYLNSLTLKRVKSVSELKLDPYGRRFLLDDNNCGFTEIMLNHEENGQDSLEYLNRTGRHKLYFSMYENVYQKFPDYDHNCAVSAGVVADNNIFIWAQIIDEYVGDVYISLTFKDNYVTVMLRKLEESLFAEFNGSFSGICKS